MFANNLPAKVTILDNTPLPTYVHFSVLALFPNLEDKFVPHSSSTAHINASPKLQALTEVVGL